MFLALVIISTGFVNICTHKVHRYNTVRWGKKEPLYLWLNQK